MRIVIIGAGISGLATAYHLQSLLPTAQITVLEAAKRPGGTLWTERHDGFQFEVGANGFLDTKRSTLELCDSLGLKAELIVANDAAKRRYLFLGDRLHRLPEGMVSFLFSRLIGWRSKWAILTERFRARVSLRTTESVHDFIARRTTVEVAEQFGDALVTGIYAGDPRLLSMGAAFPRLCEMELMHGSVTRGMKAAARQRRADAAARGEHYRGSRMYSFHAGMRRLVERLCESLRQSPQLNVRVRSVQRSANGWQIHSEGRDAYVADAVILACPADKQSEIVRELDAELADKIAELPYSAIAVVALGYRNEDLPVPADGFGFIAPQRLKRDILGVQWCSSVFPDRAPPGFTLMRVMAGGWRRRDILEWDDAKLNSAVREELKLAMRIEAPPVFHRILRWPRAIPQYHLRYGEWIAGVTALAARHPGLFLTGNAYHGVALNDCTENAAFLAEFVAKAADNQTSRS